MKIHPIAAASCAAVLLIVTGWLVGIHQRFGPITADRDPSALGVGWGP